MSPVVVSYRDAVFIVLVRTGCALLISGGGARETRSTRTTRERRRYAYPPGGLREHLI
jgi:hypothetical protein